MEKILEVEKKVIKDLTEDKLNEKNIVSAIKIGDVSSFTVDDKFMADTKVIIEYHTQADIKMLHNVYYYEVEGLAEAERGETITVENNSELAYILSTKDEFDSKIKEFAYKYAGGMIEFDAHTADVSKNEDYDTRFNYLIHAGDYSTTSVSGSNFQFHDVNYGDLNLVGDSVPETFGVGLNIHVIAKVGEYNEISGLFELEPAAITMS